MTLADMELQAAAHGTVLIEFEPECLERFIELWNRNEVRDEEGGRTTLRAVHIEGLRWMIETTRTVE